MEINASPLGDWLFVCLFVCWCLEDEVVSSGLKVTLDESLDKVVNWGIGGSYSITGCGTP